jgi:hypothetical protein
MQNGEETSGLVETLGQRLIERFTAQGWTALAEAPIPHTGVGGFTIPLDDDFSAIASFAWQPETLRPVKHSVGQLDSSGLIVEGALGVVCRPVERFISAFVGRGICGALLNSPTISVTAHHSPEVHDAADRLAAFALDQAVPLTKHYANLNALAEALDGHLGRPFIGEGSLGFICQKAQPGQIYTPLGEDEAEFVPTLLALAGRHDEARLMLARYVPSADIPHYAQDEERRRHQRFARQLTRWLDAGGELVLPTTPAEWCPSFGGLKPTPMPSFAETFEKGRREGRSRKEAIDAVRAVSHGKTRDEVKKLLEQELDRRDLTTEPLLVERQVDIVMAEREPFGKTRLILRTLKELRADSKGSSARKRRIFEQLNQEPDDAPDEQPKWLAPPERAAYKVWNVAPQWTAVALDSNSRSWLDRVAQSDPNRQAGSREVEVWLTWDSEEHVADPHLTAYIGTERVGTFDPDATEHFRPVMEAAAERDEDPYARARLTKMWGETSYLLEVALPHTAASASAV